QYQIRVAPTRVASEQAESDFAVPRMYENDGRDQKLTVVDESQHRLVQGTRKTDERTRPGNFRLVEDLFDRLLVDNWLTIYAGLPADYVRQGRTRQSVRISDPTSLASSAADAREIVVADEFELSNVAAEGQPYR